MRAKYVMSEADDPSVDGSEELFALSKGRGLVPRSELTDAEPRADTLIGYKRFRAGDIVMNKMQAWNGVVGVASCSGIISPEYSVFRPLPGVGDSRFLNYLLRTELYASVFAWKSRGMGTAFLRLHPELLLSTPLVSPPLPVQRDVANILDRETDRLNRFIAANRALLGLVRARQRAFVDSLIRIPGSSVRVKSVVESITSGPRGWAAHVTDDGAPFLRITNVQRGSVDLSARDVIRVTPPMSREADRTRVATGDVLVSITADVGSVGVVDPQFAGGYVSQHLALLRPKRSLVDASWLALCLFSSGGQMQLDVARYGGTKTQLSLDDVAEVRLSLPSLDKQRATLTRWYEVKSRLGDLEKVIGHQIRLAHERRQAMITAAVTGQASLST
jgi:type I restriction enzyme S subunit